jgi:hypothetical protein
MINSEREHGFVDGNNLDRDIKWLKMTTAVDEGVTIIAQITPPRDNFSTSTPFK